jgi:DNA polymerase-3 subunit delta'
VVSTGGKLIGVDAIRAVVEKTSDFPALVPSRFIIIDGADQMTLPASDALLKTLEEPPHTSRFFLLAETLEKVLPTIRSRCGLVRYRPLSEAFIVEYLKEIEEDPDKALVYARISGGSVGRATQYRLSGRLALRDKMLALLRVGVNGELSALFSAVDDLDDDVPLGLRFLEHLLRDLVILPHSPDRLTNLDQAEALAALRSDIGDRRLEKLVGGLRRLRGRTHLKITLPFHVKTYLAVAFSE